MGFGDGIGEWWMSYDLKGGEDIVLTRDVQKAIGSEDTGNHFFTWLMSSVLADPDAPKCVWPKGTKGKIIDDDEGPHGSVNGVLAKVVLDGESKPIVLCEGDFKPASVPNDRIAWCEYCNGPVVPNPQRPHGPKMCADPKCDKLYPWQKTQGQ